MSIKDILKNLNEAKDYPLYHVTNVNAALAILKSDTILGGLTPFAYDDEADDVTDDVMAKAVCFTRNPVYVVYQEDGKNDQGVRITFDTEKLNRKYKIELFDTMGKIWGAGGYHKDQENEERIYVDKIPNVSKYITAVTFFGSAFEDYIDAMFEEGFTELSDLEHVESKSLQPILQLVKLALEKKLITAEHYNELDSPDVVRNWTASTEVRASNSNILGYDAETIKANVKKSQLAREVSNQSTFNKNAKELNKKTIKETKKVSNVMTKSKLKTVMGDIFKIVNKCGPNENNILDAIFTKYPGSEITDGEVMIDGKELVNVAFNLPISYKVTAKDIEKFSDFEGNPKYLKNIDVKFLTVYLAINDEGKVIIESSFWVEAFNEWDEEDTTFSLDLGLSEEFTIDTKEGDKMAKEVPKSIYHCTYLETIIPIINSNKLIANDTYNGRDMYNKENTKYVCFTTDKEYTIGESVIRIELDGKKIDKDYGLINYVDPLIRNSVDEKEVRTNRDVTNLTKYIKSVDFINEYEASALESDIDNFVFMNTHRYNNKHDVSTVAAVLNSMKNTEQLDGAAEVVKLLLDKRIPLGENLKKVINNYNKKNSNQVNPDVIPDNEIGEDVLKDIQVTDIAGADELRNMFTQNGYTIVMANQMEIKAFYGDANLQIGIFLTFDNGDDFNSVDVYINADGIGPLKDKFVKYLQDKGFDEDGWREYNDIKFNLGELNNIIKLYKNVVNQFKAKAEEFEEIKKAEKKAEKASQPKKPKKEPKPQEPQEEKPMENDQERAMYMGASVTQLKSELRDLGVANPKGTKAVLVDQLIKLKHNRKVTHYGTNINMSIQRQSDTLALVTVQVIAKKNVKAIENHLINLDYEKKGNQFEMVQEIDKATDIESLCTQMILTLEGQLENVKEVEPEPMADNNKQQLMINVPGANATMEVKKVKKKTQVIINIDLPVSLGKFRMGNLSKINNLGFKDGDNTLVLDKMLDGDYTLDIILDRFNQAARLIEEEVKFIEQKNQQKQAPSYRDTNIHDDNVQLAQMKLDNGDVNFRVEIKNQDHRNVIEDYLVNKRNYKVGDGGYLYKEVEARNVSQEEFTFMKNIQGKIRELVDPAFKAEMDNLRKDKFKKELEAKKVAELKQMLKDLGVPSPKGVKTALINQILDIKFGHTDKANAFKGIDLSSKVTKDAEGTKGTEKAPEPEPVVQKASQEAPKQQVTQSQDKGVEKTPEPQPKPTEENNDSNVLAQELQTKKVSELKQMLKDLGVSSPKGVKASLVQQILDIKGGFQKQQQVFKDVDIKSSVLKELTKEDVKGTKGTEKAREPQPKAQDERPQPQPMAGLNGLPQNEEELRKALNKMKLADLKQILNDLGVDKPKGTKAIVVEMIVSQMVNMAPSNPDPEPVNRAEIKPKLSMVSNASHKEQLKRLQIIAKKWEDDINNDPDINLIFLEEPKEFKKYELPTVALAFVNYDMKKPIAELNADPIFKRFKKARGVVSVGNWFTTTDGKNVKCRMCLFVDSEFKKASAENTSVMNKLYRKYKVSESIGSFINYNGVSFLVESVGNMYVRLRKDNEVHLISLDDFDY